MNSTCSKQVRQLVAPIVAVWLCFIQNLEAEDVVFEPAMSSAG